MIEILKNSKIKRGIFFCLSFFLFTGCVQKVVSSECDYDAIDKKNLQSFKNPCVLNTSGGRLAEEQFKQCSKQYNRKKNAQLLRGKFKLLEKCSKIHLKEEGTTPRY